jgi:hypothetical protein
MRQDQKSYRLTNNATELRKRRHTMLDVCCRIVPDDPIVSVVHMTISSTENNARRWPVLTDDHDIDASEHTMPIQSLSIHNQISKSVAEAK